jgi:uncharacterized Zn finger protein
MALIRCEKCGQVFSDKYSRPECPHLPLGSKDRDERFRHVLHQVGELIKKGEVVDQWPEEEKPE